MQNRQILEWDNFWSKKQNKLFHLVKTSLTNHVVRFIKSKKKRGKILEAGCGESLTSKYLKDRFYTVGMDYSHVACNLAKKNVHKIIQGDIFKIPYKKPEFDIVFNQGVVQTVKNPLTLIKEMLRVTKDNGLVIFTVPKKASMVYFESKLNNKSSKWNVYQHFYTKKELKNLLSKLNLKFKIRNFWYNQLYIITILKNKTNELKKTMDIMSEMPNFYKTLYKIIKQKIGKRILDIGCGDGSFIKFMKNKEFIYGIDYDQYPITKAKSRFQKYKNLEFSQGNILNKNLVKQLKTYNFDTIISINVFEHIEDDMQAINNVNQILKKDGRFIILVPALRKLYGSIDKAVGHKRRYDKKELIAKLRKNNFIIEKTFYLKFCEAVGFFIIGKIFKKTLSPLKNSLLLYDKLIPLVWGIENLFRLPFGSSIVCIARKK